MPNKTDKFHLVNTELRFNITFDTK